MGRFALQIKEEKDRLKYLETLNIDYLVFMLCDPVLSSSLVPFKALAPLLSVKINEHLEKRSFGEKLAKSYETQLIYEVKKATQRSVSNTEELVDGLVQVVIQYLTTMQDNFKRLGE